MKIRLNSNQFKLLGIVFNVSLFSGAIGLSEGYPGMIDEPFFWPALMMIGFCFLLILYLLKKMKIIIVEDKPRELKNNNEH